jgi:hypothetical protein
VSYILNAFEVVGFTLELCLVVFLLFGPFRKYFVLFIYAVTMVGTTLLEIYINHTKPNSPLYRKVYWSDEVIWFFLLFLTVISLTYIALEGSPLRAKAGRVVTGIFIGVLILPFVLLHPPFFTNAHQWTSAWGAWFNGASQILDFGGAIMNLALWSALLASRKRDPQLLMVSAGLGVILTGQAIAFGLRHFIQQERWITDLLHNLSDVTGMFILCYAVRPGVKTRPAAPEALPASRDLL